MDNGYKLDFPALKIDKTADNVMDAIGIPKQAVAELSERIIQHIVSPQSIKDNNFLSEMQKFYNGGFTDKELVVMIFFAFRFLADLIQKDPKFLSSVLKKMKGEN